MSRTGLTFFDPPSLTKDTRPGGRCVPPQQSPNLAVHSLLCKYYSLVRHYIETSAGLGVVVTRRTNRDVSPSYVVRLRTRLRRIRSQ